MNTNKTLQSSHNSSQDSYSISTKNHENNDQKNKHNLNNGASQSFIKTILLCAGSSSRMQPLSNKIFMRYAGKELVLHQIDSLIEVGLEDFIIVGNKENIERIKSLIGQRKAKFSYAIQENLEDGIMGGVACTKPFIKNKESILLISSNDYVEKKAFEELLNASKNSNSNTFIVGKHVENYFPGGYLSLNQEGYIKSIVEKPKKGQEPSSLIALLVQFFRNSEQLFETYKKTSNNGNDAHEQALQMLFDAEKNAQVISYNGFWQAIKYPFHQLRLSKHFLEQMDKTFIHPEAQIAKNVVINNSYIGKGAKVMDFAVINNSYIEEGVIVGNHTLIRDSYVGKGSLVGALSEVCRSYFKEKVFLHNNYVGDSVFDQNVALGSGARTANLRLDEEDIWVEIRGEKINSNVDKLGAFIGKNVKVGINTSIMPGVCIGEESFISSSCVVEKNVPLGSFVSSKNEIFVKNNKRFTQ